MIFNCDFERSEKWRLKKHNSFTVEVVHWTRPGRFNNRGEYDTNLVTNCWNVYVIVSKNHPVFNELTEDICCSHESLESLHWGSTFCEWFRDEKGEVLTKKYGSDYMHCNDEIYESCSSQDDIGANQIFQDAYDLYKTFEKLMNTEVTNDAKRD